MDTIVMIKRLLYIAVALLISCPAWATDYYIDPSQTDPSEDGSFEHPWNSWTDFTISTGHDYRQKCGTTYSGTVSITNNGTSGDYIIIGAYYDSGGAVHEDDSPSFGENCGNDDAKPIIIPSTTTGNGIQVSADYINVNSMEAKGNDPTDGGEAIQIGGSNNIIEYCHIGEDAFFGVRVGLSLDSDNNTIRYNIIDLHDPDEDPSQDGINFQSLAQNNTAHNNYITRVGHGAIFFNHGDSNEVYDNYIVDTEVGILWNYAANSNLVHHNRLNDASMQMQGGQNNRVYYNQIKSTDVTSAGGIQLLNEGQPSVYNVTGNKFYNNTIYSSTGRGMRIYGRASESPGTVTDNEFINNAVWTTATQCIHVVDDAALVNDNYWYNNSCYGYLTNQLAIIEGSTYATATNFNVRADAIDNRDADQGFANPGSDQVWPDSAGDDVVGTGCDMNDSGSDCYDSGYTASENLLDPDTTDFTASPPAVTTEQQPAAWIIGAYGVTGSEVGQNAFYGLGGANFNIGND